MYLVPILVFLAVSTGAAACFLFLLPGKTEQRLQSLIEPDKATGWTEHVVQLVGPFAKLSSPTGDWENSPLRIKFFHAGIHRDDAHLVYYGTKTLLPVLFGVPTYLALQFGSGADATTRLFYLMMVALFACYVPNMVLSWMARRRRRDIFNSFPDAADLMLVCVEAGLGLDAALAKVAGEIKLKSMALAQELHLTLLEMRAGASRDSALRHLATRSGIEELVTFASMMHQAEKFGTAIGDSLRVFSDDLRLKRRHRAEEEAAKIPTKILFPLVICVFPSILVVILAPAGIQIVRTLLPMIGGVG